MTEEKTTTTKEKEIKEQAKAPVSDEAREIKTTKTKAKKASVSSPKKKKNIRRQVQKGKAFIRSSYNNTVVSFTDIHGNLLAWSTAGLLGFKGAKKATTYAAAQVASDAHERVQKYNLREVEIYIKGVGSGRDSALRTIAQKGYNITRIKDITPMPHNGCRAKKPRRV